MAFAQLPYRESLRDINVCLSAQAAKLYHMGFRQEIKRSTLADANESRDWRIHAEFTQCLIAQARKLYAGDSVGIELENTTYPLRVGNIAGSMATRATCPPVVYSSLGGLSCGTCTPFGGIKAQVVRLSGERCRFILFHYF